MEKMTTESLEKAVNNINSYLKECGNDRDTITLTINVLKSVKQNYEELIECRAEIERLQSILLRFLDEISAWGDKNNVDTTNFSIIPIAESEKESLVKQLKDEIIKDFSESLKNKAAERCDSEYCAYIDDIDSVVKEKMGDCK